MRTGHGRLHQNDAYLALLRRTLALCALTFLSACGGGGGGDDDDDDSVAAAPTMRMPPASGLERMRATAEVRWRQR